MNDAVRQRLMKALDEMSKLHPEMRLGQLVTIIAYWARGASDTAVWDVDDEQLLQAALSHLEQRKSSASRKSKRAV
jgi:hypothetical protein